MAERIELHSLNGLRFFATLGIILGHAIESTWIDDGNVQTLWLSSYTCSVFRRSADDLVSFYFILSGFGLQWGYSSRDLESSSVRQKYWIKRLQRFYPDFLLSSILSFLLQSNSLVGCGIISVINWIFNCASFFLLSAWLIFFPGTVYLNGPAWFIVTLAWLWLGFPLFQSHLVAFCRSQSTPLFILKLLALWLLSLVPWMLVLGFSQFSLFASFNNLVLGVRWCPLFRICEFMIGVLVAVKLAEDNEYTPIEDIAKRDGSPRQPSSAPLPLLLCSCAAALAALVAFHVTQALAWDPTCSCLEMSLGCYGWLQFIDPRFAPVSALMIYAIASLDCAAARADAPGAAAPSGGVVESGLRGALSWGPFREVNKWGLQVFLYQSPVITLVQALFVDVHWGIESRCTRHHVEAPALVLYVAAQVVCTYAVAWLMHEEGVVGRYVQQLWLQVTALVVGLLEARPVSPRRQNNSPIRYA